MFKESIAGGGVITSLLAKGCGSYTRNQLDNLTDFTKKLGASGLIWIRMTENGLESPTVKFFSEEEQKNLIANVITSYSIHYTKLYDACGKFNHRSF